MYPTSLSDAQPISFFRHTMVRRKVTDSAGQQPTNETGSKGIHGAPGTGGASGKTPMELINSREEQQQNACVVFVCETK